jgi:hypothetical protein
VATLINASLPYRTDELRMVSTELQRAARELCEDLMVQLAIMQRLVMENRRLRLQRGTLAEPTLWGGSGRTTQTPVVRLDLHHSGHRAFLGPIAAA